MLGSPDLSAHPRRAPRLRSNLRILAGVLALATACSGPEERPPRAEPAATGTEIGRPGGRLVVALRAEPKTFNPLVAPDRPSLTVIRRMMADLVHINRHSQLTEPALAAAWQASEDGRRLTVELRRDVRFSDGHPLDADDVVFSFRAYLDPEIGSPQRSLLVVAGQPLEVRKLDSHRIEFEFAAPYAVGDRLFDSIAILPEHLLAEAWTRGELARAWSTASPPAALVGLGPFRLREYVPGERLVLERNPHYWKQDAEGNPLPYLEELVFVFVASEDAQTIRFQAGETDVIEHLTGENFSVLEPEAERRGYVLADVGPDLSYEFLFFNMNDLDEDASPALAAAQGWFRRLEFRRAVSRAIDREAIVRLVYQGRATPLGSHVSPGNRRWFNPAVGPPVRSLEAARRDLTAAGFTWDERGRLRDAAGRPVEFTLVTNSSNNRRVQMATIIQEDLAELGMQVDLVPLEFRALLDRILHRFDYEACILGFGSADADPNPDLSVLLSSGESRLWRLSGGPPETPWQAELDRLLEEQLTVLDYERRKQLYDRVQQIVADHLPAVYLVSPNMLVGAKIGLGNFRPAVLEHPTLWNADELFWRP